MKPEKQDSESFADGILHIAEAQKRVAMQYMEDGGYELACPPLRAVLSLMAFGEYEGKTIHDPELRKMFSREAMISSDWYQRRLATKKHRDIDHWKDMVHRLNAFLDSEDEEEINELKIHDRLAYARQQLERVQADDYEDSLIGTLGADPMQPSMKDATLVDRLAGA
ncbi:MAG: hypothetical protein AAGI63_11935 [Planctomycetota bacterium]